MTDENQGALTTHQRTFGQWLPQTRGGQIFAASVAAAVGFLGSAAFVTSRRPAIEPPDDMTTKDELNIIQGDGRDTAFLDPGGRALSWDVTNSSRDENRRPSGQPDAAVSLVQNTDGTFEVRAMDVAPRSDVVSNGTEPAEVTGFHRLGAERGLGASLSKPQLIQLRMPSFRAVICDNASSVMQGDPTRPHSANNDD